MPRSVICLLAICLLARTASGLGGIRRWDTVEVIPGTEGIILGPGLRLDHRQLQFANLRLADISSARFDYSDLSNARFDWAKLANADFTGSVVMGTSFLDTTSFGFTASQLYSTQSYQAKNLTGIDLGVNQLRGWDLHNQDLSNARFDDSYLTDTNFTGAVVTGASFDDVTRNGFTAAQLYSTRSYQLKDLRGVNFTGNFLHNWDLHGQNLTKANFYTAFLRDTDLTGAVVASANFNRATEFGFSAAQLYSTQSYQSKDLSGIILAANNLVGWDFHDQNLTNAQFGATNLTDANFAGALVTGGAFSFSVGFSASQLYSTRSYQERNLHGIWLDAVDLAGWDFHEQDLTDGFFDRSTFANANLAGSLITAANFGETTAHGFTADQLYSTRSYQSKDLRGVLLYRNDLTGWDFHQQDLTNALFNSSSVLSANFTGADIAGASFYDTTVRGFTAGQLYSTRSYQVKNLWGVNFGGNNLANWDLSGQNLVNANFDESQFASANFNQADLRGASSNFLRPLRTITRNAILSAGNIQGLR